MNNLIYLVYGNDERYVRQVRFSVASALQHRPRADDFTITIYTTSPEALGDLPVRVRPITPGEFEQWIGPRQYKHRAKIRVMQVALRELSGAVILVDTDTVFRECPGKLFHRLAPGCALMHAYEKAVKRECSDIAEALKGVTVEVASKYRWQLDTSTLMWNSGVVGLLPEYAYLADDALVLVDAFRAASDIFVMEQVAFTESLRRSCRIVPTDDVVFHYYGPRLDFAEAQIDRLLSTVPIAAERFCFEPRKQGALRRAVLKLWLRLQRRSRDESRLVLALDAARSLRGPDSALQRAGWERIIWRLEQKLGPDISRRALTQLTSYRNRVRQD